MGDHAATLRKMREHLLCLYADAADTNATRDALDAYQQNINYLGIDNGLDAAKVCACPSGDGSLRWPCPQHPPELDATYQSATDSAGIGSSGELDAAKGGEFGKERECPPEFREPEMTADERQAAYTRLTAKLRADTTPPTQPGDAVERVAEAIVAADLGTLPAAVRRWDNLTNRERDFYRRMARAAIAAMPASGEGVDAARYRWLRVRADSLIDWDCMPFLPAGGKLPPLEMGCSATLDAAIDAARGEG